MEGIGNATLYVLAVSKYLKLRKPGFDYQNDFGGVIYLFLRGLRLDNQTGVFFHKPSETVITAMTSIFNDGFLY